MEKQEISGMFEYLVYVKRMPETGTEGSGRYVLYCICGGNNLKELMYNYSNKMKGMYDIDIELILKENGKWYSDYSEIGFTRLPNSVYGDPENLEIIANGSDV